MGAKKISVFALNKVSEPSFVARNLIIIILYSSVMVKSVAREMGGSRKELYLQPIHHLLVKALVEESIEHVSVNCFIGLVLILMALYRSIT